MTTTFPVYKIEVWEPGAGSPLYTIEQDALHVRAKETLTNNIGNFTFALPTTRGLHDVYHYDDIEVYDTAKIWFGYDSISGDPFTVGKIYRISGILSTPLGYQRVFSGRNQGEILQRRLKGMKTWSAVDASVIVTELANDLSLGTGEIDTDTTDVTMTIEVDRYETYFNMLRAVSDYWYDAGTQVKKDFYVDVDNNLVWKARPIRTAGVETFTVGDNIISYNVLRDIESVKNKIYIYGAKEKKYPADGDSWTETLDIDSQSPDDWEAGGGTMSVSLESSKKIVGSYSIELSVDSSDYYGRLVLDLPSGYHPNLNHYPTIHFQIARESAYSSQANLILEDDNSKYAQRQFQITQPDQWHLINIGAGRHHEADWNEINSGFNWEDVTQIIWDVHFSGTGTGKFWIDNLFFNSRNFYGLAEDATSQSNYGLREATFIDEELRSDSECEKRAKTLLYQLKNTPMRIDLQVPGNTNLKIGDRLSMTIPAEGITSQNYDVISVEHIFSQEQGFRTNAIMLNTADLRDAPPLTMQDVLRRQFKIQRAIAKISQVE